MHSSKKDLAPRKMGRLLALALIPKRRRGALHSLRKRQALAARHPPLANHHPRKRLPARSREPRHFLIAQAPFQQSLSDDRPHHFLVDLADSAVQRLDIPARILDQYAAVRRNTPHRARIVFDGDRLGLHQRTGSPARTESRFAIGKGLGPRERGGC